MNITLNETKITQDSKNLAFEKNSGVDEIVVTVDTDESWSYKLDVKYPDKYNVGNDTLYNVIDLDRNGDICSVILTREMLPFNGKYTMQLRGINGDKVYHSDTFEVWVKYSIEPGSTYNPVPSEFYQVEARLDNKVDEAKQYAENAEIASTRMPKISPDNTWLIWDAETGDYVDTGIVASGGTTDHSKLINRSEADQHPMSAITGLEKALESKQPAGAYLTDKDLDTTLKETGKAADAAEVGKRLSSLSEEIASLQGGGGQAGKDGVGIQSVEQTTTSTEDGGTNIVTVTKTDGTTSAFTVRNGRKGSTGPAGADGKDGAPGKDGAAGKSAYQYAQDGGYTGTEEEFAAVLAGKSVTSYVSAAAEDIITKMKAVQGPGTFNFVLLTDLHYCPVKYGQVYENLSDYDTVVKNIVDAVNLVNEEVGLELLLTLGDNVEGQNYTDSTTGLPSTTAGRASQSLSLIRAKVNDLEVAFRALDIPRLSCKGNHDDGSISAYYGESDHKYYLGYIMQDGDYYNRFFRRNANSGRVTLSDDVSDLAAYVDLDTSKVRLITLNSVDIPYTANSDGSCVYLDGLGQYMGGQHVFGYSQAQLDWLANVALDFSGKRKPGEWSVMIFQHHPVLSTFGKRANSTPDYQTFNYDVFAGIVNAYQHGTAYSHASATGKTQSGAESSYFACEVSADFSAQGAGKVISIWNGHIHRDLYSKTVFDGYESNTEITPNFTNRFSNTDSDFQSGYRLNSSGGVSADSAYWVSGYIPLTKGQTLRVKYGSTDSAPVWASRPCLLPFNSSKAKNGDPVYSSTTTHGITLDSDNAGFTYVCELDNNAYVRISGRGTGDGVIVTVDEEISYTEQTTDGDGVQTVFISTMLANPNEGSADAAWDGTKYGHEVGTASETSVDFVTVDTSSKKIYTFRYGAGADREISY